MATAGSCRGDDPTKVPQNGTCLWFNDGCLIGCDRCVPGNLQGLAGCKLLNKSQPMEPTLPDEFRSWPDESFLSRRHGGHGHVQSWHPDFTKHNPWRAPGHAPVESPCGLAGGYSKPLAGNGGYAPAGVKAGFDGRLMPESPRTIWPAGSSQEVATSVNANHGGGYSYRVCPKSEMFTEECFQRHPLKFSGEQQWIQWGSNKSSRVAVPALRVDQGTKPLGSQWTRFPIPACGGYLGGDAAGGSDVPGRVQAGDDCNTTQFKPPVPGLFGYGLTQCLYPNHNTPTGGVIAGRACTDKEIEEVKQLFNVNVVDLVKIPSDLPPGEYVLSWRHDCEQTAQVWAACADITVTSPAPEMVV